jgi:hypothetical protein
MADASGGNGKKDDNAGLEKQADLSKIEQAVFHFYR